MTSLRRAGLVAGFAGFAFALSVGEASAWYCRADSRQAYGWGSSPRLGVAKRIALSQCAVRTRRGLYCRISYCR